MQFLPNFVTTSLIWLKFGMKNYFCTLLMMSIFSLPKRPYKGQVSDLLAFAQSFFENSLRSIQKLLEFEVNFLKKNIQGQQPLKQLSDLG